MCPDYSYSFASSCNACSFEKVLAVLYLSSRIGEGNCCRAKTKYIISKSRNNRLTVQKNTQHQDQAALGGAGAEAASQVAGTEVNLDTTINEDSSI